MTGNAKLIISCNGRSPQHGTQNAINQRYFQAALIIESPVLPQMPEIYFLALSMVFRKIACKNLPHISN
ncbi:MAG: hypothetical protein R3C26_14635 [Calditrichia bacterium]